jgi:protease-4
MSSGNSWTKSLFVGLWSILNFCRKLFFNLIFIALFIGLLSILMKDNNKIIVPSDSALVLKLSGSIVIEKRGVDPFEEFMQEAFEDDSQDNEILLQDVLLTIENAKQDNRIKVLVLDLQQLSGGGLDKLEQISQALVNFKESGKPVYAILFSESC